MIKGISCIGLILLLLFSACARKVGEDKEPGSGCMATTSKTLEVNLHAQQVDQWCWAASGQMIMEFLKHDVSQCVQAQNRLGLSTCCASPIPKVCNKPGWPEFAKYNFDFKRTTDTALSWDTLKEQISCKDSPVGFSWGWVGGSGHMMVAVGFKSGNGVNLVYVNDPWEPGVGKYRLPMTYEEYVSGSDHTHWDDFYDLKYKGGD